MQLLCRPAVLSAKVIGRLLALVLTSKFVFSRHLLERKQFGLRVLPCQHRSGDGTFLIVETVLHGLFPTSAKLELGLLLFLVLSCIACHHLLPLSNVKTRPCFEFHGTSLFQSLVACFHTLGILVVRSVEPGLVVLLELSLQLANLGIVPRPQSEPVLFVQRSQCSLSLLCLLLIIVPTHLGLLTFPKVHKTLLCSQVEPLSEGLLLPCSLQLKRLAQG
mmetsp:Transcript_37660/g.61043  ORF Transcript_37660/g.61043 Transcript_37660/m.61043 type:complete len:219 (-) Transcript_37660:32-688(-)